MKKKPYYVSRKKTPWSDKTNITPLEAFINNVYFSHYNLKHPKIVDSLDSIMFSNFYPISCPYCGSIEFIKKGLSRDKKQRYYCKECQKRFTFSTGTLMDHHKIPLSEWIEFLLNIFSFSSLNHTSKNNKNSPTTTKYWLKKVFIALEDYQQDILLKGNVYIDETYYKVVQSKLEKKANGKEYAGLSRNQICIGVGYDGIHTYAFIEGKGKTNTNKTNICFLKHIQEGSHLIHDKERGHYELVEQLNLTSESYDAIQLRNVEDMNNPLEPINHQIDLLQKFLKSHAGFNREELQDYLNLFCFIMNEGNDPLEKVKKMLLLLIKKQERIKYREYFKKS